MYQSSVMGPDSLQLMGKISKSRNDLNLGTTMPNIEHFRVIFIFYNVVKFHVPRSVSF